MMRQADTQQQENGSSAMHSFSQHHRLSNTEFKHPVAAVASTNVGSRVSAGTTSHEIETVTLLLRALVAVVAWQVQASAAESARPSECQLGM